MQKKTHHQRNTRTKLGSDSAFGAVDEVGGKLEDVLVLARRGSRFLVDLEASRELHESIISR
jgi:hypothetical protein